MKSFEELYNEFNRDPEINHIGQKALKQTKRRVVFAMIFCMIATIVFIHFIVKLQIDSDDIPVFVLFTISMNVVIYFSITTKDSKERQKFFAVFKEKIIKKMINNFFNNLEYFPDKIISNNFYDEAQYNEDYNVFSADDYITAKIKNTYGIDMAEVMVEKQIVYKERTERRIFFHGLFARICIEKNIHANLRITPKSCHYDNQIEMDLGEFEKEFNVFASDRIKGMQILTADIMEKILEFKQKTQQKFDICINDNTIYIRFACGYLFEPKYKAKVMIDKKSLQTYYNILDFTNELANKIIKAVNDVEI